MQPGDHIDDLSYTGNLENLTLAQEYIQPLCDNECILKVIHLFCQMWRFGPGSKNRVALVPNLPFIPGKIDVMGAASFRLHIMQRTFQSIHEALEGNRTGEIAGCVICPITSVIMHG